MCLVALAWKCHPRWRLLLAGNRDEFHSRSTASLAVWSPPDGLLAGRDLQSGGTWAGTGRSGRCAVVTNVRAPAAALAAPPSRGALPVEFLAGDATAARQARAILVRAAAYAPFNLLLADAETCEYLGNHPQPQHRTLAPGIHGVSNGALTQPWPKTRRLCEVMRAWLQTNASDPELMWRALADERSADDAELPDTGVGLELERRLSSAFIRGPDYGTRASTLIAIDHSGRGTISERRFGPDGVFQGETILQIPQQGQTWQHPT